MPHTLKVDDITEFKAKVCNDFGNTVYQIHGREIIKSGVMRSETDVIGLARHLSRLKVIPPGEPIRRV